MLLLLVTLAHADTWVAYSLGFPVETRTDAPIDSLVPYDANWSVTATARIDGGEPIPLAWDFGEPLATPGFRGPDGLWPAGSTVELTVLGYYEEDLATTLTFTVGEAAADPVLEPVIVGDPAVSYWREEGSYASGCCERTREVTFTVRSDAEDPWARVELRGELRKGKGVEMAPLTDAFGPGTHTLTYTQREEDDGTAVPGCFEVIGISASGARSAAQSVCVETGGGPLGVLGKGGCDTSGAGAGWLAALALVAVRRRRG